MILRQAKLGVALAIALVILWWASLQPRQDRDWKPEVALLPHAEIDGELDDAAWLAAPWTEDFVDIEGDARPQPLHRRLEQAVGHLG